MKNIISAELSGKVLLIFFMLLIIFHAFVLIGIVPNDIVWAGMAAEAGGDLIALEAVSISILVLFVFFVLSKLKSIRTKKVNKLITVALWFMFLFFLLNTLGNITSEVTFEKMFFTPITIILSLLSLRLAIAK